ncbi:MAG: DUF4154 domain-containing protein [Flavobacteriales bacterium]|nr:DUF4154 domain-containing protein [Flavobacteriales bacterium]
MRSLQLIAFLFLSIQLSFSQSGLETNKSIRNKQRVNYIYNITDYITWSHLDNNTAFRIGVFGKDQESLIEEFKKVAAKKRIKNLPVRVVKITNVSEIKDLEIVYIHKRDKLKMEDILPQLTMEEVLLVSENYPFRVSMINFMEFENEFHFDVNVKNINNAGLLVSPQLLTFSIQQQKDWEEIFEKLELEQEVIEEQTNELKELNREIEHQQLQLDAQREQIRLQQRSLVEQLEEIRIRKEELENKLEEINVQQRELARLKRQVGEKSEETTRLTNTLNQQEDTIEYRKRLLMRQKHKALEQEQRILSQVQAINNQEKELDNQLGRLRSQGLLIYVFSIIIVIILALIILAWRQYKRKKRSEAEVRIQNKKLMALNESLDSFVYRVSHDLKAPVINVKNMVSMLKENTEEQENNTLTTKIIENLELSSNRLDLTITDLLELSRIEKVEEEREKVNIQEVFNTILKEYERELKEIGAIVKTSFQDSGTYSSSAELSSVFQNLLTNSIKYRSKNRPLEIVLSTRNREGVTVLDYKDNGQGIDLKKFEGKLFSMFQRFTSDQSISGTGVGMYIIKRLIDKNNGSISLESEPDKGLRYLITLPAKNSLS